MKYGSRRRVRSKYQSPSATGWLRMRVWRLSLWRTKSDIISWAGSFCHWIFQEGKLRDSCTIGPSDIPLEDKTVTICYGSDMVNVEFVNFVCASREVATVSYFFRRHPFFSVVGWLALKFQTLLWLFLSSFWYGGLNKAKNILSRLMTKPTKWHVHPVMTGHPPSLVRVFTVRMKKAWVLIYPLSAQQRLIRLGRCPGWSESLLSAVILLVLSWGGSFCFFLIDSKFL